MSELLLTGFPGFLGVGLLPKLLAERPKEVKVHCLVQTRYINYAKKRLSLLTAETPEYAKRVELLEGDITKPGLGLESGKWAREIGEVFHLAAAQDLAVSRELGKRVNIDGTRNVLNFASDSAKFARFHYVSTCHVSGKHPGLFRERDLEVGQRFHNHYEETKFEAEVLVSEARAGGLPATVYRPAMISGDAASGETQKYDGPYYLVRWMLSLPRITPFPVFGGGASVRLNVVPRNVVVNAITYLSGREESLGKTYQIADPHPMPVAMLVREMGRVMGKTLLPVPMPRDGVKLVLRHVSKLQRWMQIPPQMLDYLSTPSRYSVETLMVGLKGSGIHVPRISTYLPAMVEFVRNHSEITSRPML